MWSQKKICGKSKEKLNEQAQNRYCQEGDKKS